MNKFIFGIRKLLACAPWYLYFSDLMKLKTGRCQMAITNQTANSSNARTRILSDQPQTIEVASIALPRVHGKYSEQAIIFLFDC